MVVGIPTERRVSSLSILWFLAACHVFEDIEVNCTSDMPCAKTDDTGTTDSGGDTGEDTGDTGSAGEPSVGWVVSLTGGGKGIVRVFDPVTQEVAQEWTGFGEVGGAAWWNPETGDGLLVGAEDLVQLYADGSATMNEGGGIRTEAYDLSSGGSQGLLAAFGGVYVFDEQLDTKEFVPAGTFNQIKYIGSAFGGDAWFVDVSNGGPDLWVLRGEGDFELVYEDYDSSTTRASNVFAGPDDEPYACSSAGAVFSLAALQGGDTRPEEFYDGELTDVSDCAWDASAEAFLLYSPTAGIVRLDRFGRSEQVYEPSNGFTLHKVVWYQTQ